jgi:argininosuccinate lyase
LTTLLHCSFSNATALTNATTNTPSTHTRHTVNTSSPSTQATDLAYYLVRKQVPFREAHGLAGKAVSLAEQKSCELGGLTVEDYKSIHPAFEADVLKTVSEFEVSVDQYVNGICTNVNTLCS